jgi:hypothetical protein
MLELTTGSRIIASVSATFETLEQDNRRGSWTRPGFEIGMGVLRGTIEGTLNKETQLGQRLGFVLDSQLHRLTSSGSQRWDSLYEYHAKIKLTVEPTKTNTDYGVRDED